MESDIAQNILFMLPRYCEEETPETQQVREARAIAQTAIMQGTAVAMACEAFYRQMATCLGGAEEEKEKHPLFTHKEIMALLRAVAGHLRV